MKECSKPIVINDRSIDELKELIKSYLTDKRYHHSICVMNEAERLGCIYIPEKINKLKVAALLHDITKKADFEKQLQYCREFDIILDTDYLDSPEVLHAITATALAKRDFGDFVDDEILSAIRNHTTGNENMTLFDTIIHLADYIEESRVHDSCKTIRMHLYDKLDQGEDRLDALYDTMICMFDNTISYLIEKGSVINKDTVAARNYFIKLRNSTETRG